MNRILFSNEQLVDFKHTRYSATLTPSPGIDTAVTRKLWTTWSFGNDWQEAENWRLQIAQAAGL